MLRALAAGLLLTLAFEGCGARARVPGRPQRTSVAGHYAEVWGAADRTVLLLPPGGWAADGPGGVRALRPVARRFVAMGWRALTTSYANGPAGIATVSEAWREASARGPACVYGESSGAHWALVLAARDPAVRCVVSAAGPTDLVTWPQQLRGPISGEARRLRTAAFGADRAVLEHWSPAASWPAHDCVRLLLLTARNDPIVPYAQAEELQRRARHSTLIQMRPGAIQWVHSKVRAADLDAAWHAVRDQLDDRGAPGGCQR